MRIGGKPLKAFRKITHAFPVLSLKDVMDAEKARAAVDAPPANTYIPYPEQGTVHGNGRGGRG